MQVWALWTYWHMDISSPWMFWRKDFSAQGHFDTRNFWHHVHFSMEYFGTWRFQNMDVFSPWKAIWTFWQRRCGTSETVPKWQCAKIFLCLKVHVVEKSLCWKFSVIRCPCTKTSTGLKHARAEMSLAEMMRSWLQREGYKISYFLANWYNGVAISFYFPSTLY